MSKGDAIIIENLLSFIGASKGATHAVGGARQYGWVAPLAFDASHDQTGSKVFLQERIYSHNWYYGYKYL